MFAEATLCGESYLLVFALFQAILAGDYILSVASSMLAKIGNSDVVSIVSQVVEDMVRGVPPSPISPALFTCVCLSHANIHMSGMAGMRCVCTCTICD